MNSTIMRNAERQRLLGKGFTKSGDSSRPSILKSLTYGSIINVSKKKQHFYDNAREDDDEEALLSDQQTMSASSYSSSSSSSFGGRAGTIKEDSEERSSLMPEHDNGPMIIILNEPTTTITTTATSDDDSSCSSSHAVVRKEELHNAAASLSTSSSLSAVVPPVHIIEEDAMERGLKAKVRILNYQNQSLSYSESHGCSFDESGTIGTQWTVSESTALTSSEDLLEKEPPCCSLPGLGRGFTVPGWVAYNKSLDENPVMTKALTSLCGWFLGDFVTQLIITGGPFDIHRSIALASFGFFFHGPVGHVIYDNLDRIIVGNGPKEIIAKICVDQILWCPAFMICYFTYLGLANGDGPTAIVAKIHEDIFTAILGSWKVWPLAHAVQFRYVATKHRIIYINCIEVCFIMFLSFLGNR